MYSTVTFWIGTVVVLLVIEAATQGLTTIWFAGGALAALVLALFDLPLWIQAGVFACVSVLLLFLTRPLAVRLLHVRSVPTNADSLVGQDAVVTERIDNLHETGVVKIRGQEWTARSVRNEVEIEEKEIVTVRAIEGVKLIVGRKDVVY